ncbi:MAG: BlaI/MecI/CopY family transcriptional regulator [Bacteroidales bacterium]|nr:BlaI/MecI/CopY family transcriptional regulator [Bacteroidales bacterium]
MDKRNYNPTDSELEILQILWVRGEARVKEVHEILQQSKEVGYTTVLKIMQIMYDKKLVERRTEGKGHVYNSLVAKETVQDGFLDKIVDKVYSGSAANLVMSALGNYSASKSELEQIKEFIRQQENKEE